MRNIADLLDEDTPDIKVLRQIIEIETGEVKLEISAKRHAGKRLKHRVPKSLSVSPRKVVEQLLDLNAVLPTDPKDAGAVVGAALRSKPKKPPLDVTRVGGWHDRVFVQPAWSEGHRERPLEMAADVHDSLTLTSKGDADEWRVALEPVCASSSWISFAIGVGFAGPLLGILDDPEGAVFNFFGASSTGKSLSLRCAQSLIGQAGKNDLATFGISPRGLEELCLARTDTVVILDEQSRLDGTAKAQRRTIRSMAFKIPSGQGNVRSRVVRELPQCRWRAQGLTCSETPLDDPRAPRRLPGEAVRHIDVPVPSLEAAGVFDRLPKRDRLAKAAELARKSEEVIAGHYGVALRRYVRHLAANPDAARAGAESIISSFTDHFACEQDAWRRRFVRKFAVVAAGMVMAAEAGAAPWSAKHARHCASRVFRASAGHLLCVDEKAAEVVSHLGREVANLDRWPVLKKGDRLSSKQVRRLKGFRREHPRHGDLIAVRPSFFQELAGPDHALVLDRLVAKGSVVRDATKRHLQLAIGGLDDAARPRWVAFRRKALEG